jgi:radical SAM superfamily enzyme YgiQ (UPF0313 family)
MYVSAALKEYGHKVKVLNCNLFDYDLEKELVGVSNVFFTGYGEFESEIKRVASICREKGICTHLGGGLATYTPEKMVNHINCLYGGEFDGYLPIDNIPWPDYVGFGISEYHRRHPCKYMGVLTSRGCPHSCSFCSSISPFRVRNLLAVEQEIDYYISRYQLDMIVFNDNTLNANLNRFEAICRMMLNKGVAWTCALRLDNITDSVIKLAKRSGLVYCIVGIESFSQEKLDKMNKNITVEQIENGLSILEANDVGYHGNVIVGFEGETESDVAAEFEDLKARPWNVFPVYLQKFCGVNANPVKNQPLVVEFTDYIKQRGMYCFPEANND